MTVTFKNVDPVSDYQAAKDAMVAAIGGVCQVGASLDEHNEAIAATQAARNAFYRLLEYQVGAGRDAACAGDCCTEKKAGLDGMAQVGETAE